MTAARGERDADRLRVGAAIAALAQRDEPSAVDHDVVTRRALPA